MKVSVIICTYNRNTLLQKVLEALKNQYKNMLSEEAFNDYLKQLEILIVDNNSTDPTKQVIESFKDSMPLKYVFEKEQGLSFARNRAVKEASGELLAFLDDDIVLSDRWLYEVINVIFKIRFNKEQIPAVIGGKVLPLWEKKKPSWINTKPPFALSQSVFPFHDYGDVPSLYPITERGQKIQNPLGANMIFHKNVFDKYGFFRTDLGTSGNGGLGLHEDTEYCRFLADHGESLMYIPQICVYHPIPASRMQKDFVKSWYRKSGRSLYWMLKTSRGPRKVENNFIGIPHRFKKILPGFLERICYKKAPVYLYLKLIALNLVSFFSYLSFSPKIIFWFSAQIAKNHGEIEAAKIVNGERVLNSSDLGDNINAKESHGVKK